MWLRGVTPAFLSAQLRGIPDAQPTLCQLSRGNHLLRVRVANIGATHSPDVDADPLRGPLLPFAAEVPSGRPSELRVRTRSTGSVAEQRRRSVSGEESRNQEFASVGGSVSRSRAVVVRINSNLTACRCASIDSTPACRRSPGSPGQLGLRCRAPCAISPPDGPRHSRRS